MIHPLLRMAWEHAETKPLYVVLLDNQLVIEAPEEEDRDEPNCQSIIRLFYSQEDGEIYAGQIFEWNPDSKLLVLKTSLQEIFKLLEELQIASVMDQGVPAKLDISMVEPGEFPVTIDTIWSAFESPPQMSN